MCGSVWMARALQMQGFIWATLPLSSDLRNPSLSPPGHCWTLAFLSWGHFWSYLFCLAFLPQHPGVSENKFATVNHLPSVLKICPLSRPLGAELQQHSLITWQTYETCWLETRRHLSAANVASQKHVPVRRRPCFCSQSWGLKIQFTKSKLKTTKPATKSKHKRL